ncbi:MAG: acetoacetyl-[acyl-carrier protein] synthase [Lentisphaeria bacterium]|jgi:acetoacetyl-[acyl-carrier protein] synthase
MGSKLPVIVSFGGFNAAGRSSGHIAYKRMILESLDAQQKQETLSALAKMMRIGNVDSEEVTAGTLVRKIEVSHFDVDKVPLSKKFNLESSAKHPVSFTISRRQMPENIPGNWALSPLDEEGKEFRVTLLDDQEIKIDTTESIGVKAAGQLPSGFDPSSYYRSQNHPRGLQMAIMGASDAVKSMGVDWSTVTRVVPPDQISVYSASIMSQLDNCGFGGLFYARNNSIRATSKQIAMGLNTMPADFVNAYVLGNLGSTGGIAGACATFLYNLRLGVDDIRSGRSKVAVIGASEAPILPEVIDGYAAMSALATDANLQKLDGVSVADYRRASRPFGDNCGFTIAESSQYVVLMADDLAVELGAKIYGAVPSVYVNADGFKKSISAPGAGNYITMAKAVGLASTLLGLDAVRQRSFVQAHGSSTPQNRITESLIFDSVAQAFGIESWPVTAIKAYLGHSLAASSGDQLAATMGVFEYGVLPGIKTITSIADDVAAQRLRISPIDQNLGAENCEVAFLNSKGFGGNNATAVVFSPSVVGRYLGKNYSSSQLAHYRDRCDATYEKIAEYKLQADSAHFDPIYEFGNKLIEVEQIEISSDSVKMPGYEQAISLTGREGLLEF